jgi:DUF4097 and DUF4098 domain-containing protein YvlB
MRWYAIPLTLVSISLVLVVPAIGMTIDRDYHETFDVREGVRLDLRHGDGDVTVTPWDKDVIDVRVRYFAEVKRLGFTDEPDFFVDFDQTEDVVRVVGREEIGSGVVFFQSIKEHEYTYTISAPSYVRLELNGDDGDVSITGWRSDIDCVLDDGDVELQDVSNAVTRISLEDGDVSIRGLEGELIVSGDDGDIALSDSHVTTARISLQDGDVNADKCEGEFRVSVDDGDVHLDRLVSDRIEISGEDGDMRVALVGTELQELVVSTDDGDIDVSLAPGLSYTFVITMDDGNVKVGVPNVEEFDQREHAVTGRVGGGRGRVHLSTADGNVVLEER